MKVRRESPGADADHHQVGNHPIRTPESRAVSIRTISESPAAPDQPTPRALRLVADPKPTEQLPLALRWEVSPGVPAVPEVPRGLHIVGDPGEPGEFPDFPEPRQWVARLAAAVSDVMIGARPASQLTRWLTRDQLIRVSTRATAIARHPSARAQRGTPRARTVRAVRVCPVAPGVIEASAVLVGGDRSQAIAFRIEAVAGRWLATVVDLR